MLFEYSNTVGGLNICDKTIQFDNDGWKKSFLEKIMYRA